MPAGKRPATTAFGERVWIA